ncbi:MAG: hypothetical protein QXZ70_02280 [Candidatus Bathyarchaeia archaeon]
MISELLMNYVFDRLNKQIIERLPYCLLLSLIMYTTFNVEYFLVPLVIISLIIFTTATTLFNKYINKALEQMLIDINFKSLIRKMSNIFEGGNSLLDDIKASENWRMITLGVSSGLFFFLLLTSTCLMIFNYLRIGIELVFPIMIILVVYLYQDIVEIDLLKEYQTKKTELPFLQDIVEMYTVNNSLKSIRIKSLSKAILRFGSRILGPLCYLTVPKLYSDMFIVYKNPEIVSFIKNLAKKDAKVYIKYEGGQSIDNFFTEGQCEKISMLHERSPKENFPYLFNPDYSYSEKDRKKWTALSLNEKETKKEKVLGYMFIHLFKGISMKRKTKPGRRPNEPEIKPKEALLFILIGERNYMGYLKVKLEVISTKYPSDLISMEQQYS